MNTPGAMPNLQFNIQREMLAFGAARNVVPGSSPLQSPQTSDVDFGVHATYAFGSTTRLRPPFAPIPPPVMPPNTLHPALFLDTCTWQDVRATDKDPLLEDPDILGIEPGAFAAYSTFRFVERWQYATEKGFIPPPLERHVHREIFGIHSDGKAVKLMKVNDEVEESALLWYGLRAGDRPEGTRSERRREKQVQGYRERENALRAFAAFGWVPMYLAIR